MRVLVTGVAGQLGHDVMNELIRRRHEGIGTDLAARYAGAADGSAVTKAPYFSLDITDERAVQRVIRQYHPDAVVHCAAWTAVDQAEEPEKQPLVRAINVDGTKAVAGACADVGAKLAYISTDYVFSGEGDTPWKPEDATEAPLNYYGRTKLEGEKAVREATDRHFIVRTAWVFGKSGRNFIRTMLNVGKKVDTVRVVMDQIGTPTYTFDLARLLADMIETDRFGTYHATNEGGFISWYDFTREIYRQAGYATAVVPVTTAEYGVSRAKRPFNSRLDKSKLAENGFAPLPAWQDALTRYLREIAEEEG